MTRQPAARCVAFFGPPGAPLKQGIALWEGIHGGAGLIFWTGVYWQVQPFVEPTAEEHAAIKRGGPRSRVDALERVTDDPFTAAWVRWRDRALVPLTARQADYLELLGAPAPPHLPKPVAGRVISIVRQARDHLRQAPRAPAAATVVDALVTLADASAAMDYWQAALALERAIPGYPDR